MAWTLVLLHRPDDAPVLDEEARARLQADHLAYLDGLRAAGTLVLSAGARHPDGTPFGGASVYRTDLDTARALAEQDPAVQAGRLRVQALSWELPAGDEARIR